MHPILEHLGVALGLATLAGVNLYLTVLLTGLAVRFDLLNLAAQHQELEVLGHPVVLIVAGVLFCLEFFADKVPWVDSLWDGVHTFIRPVGGVMLGLTALGDVPVYVQVAAALVAGGAALTTHGAKAGTRLLVNHSPEPVSNTALSLTEDVAVIGGTALTLLNPVVGLIVFASILLVLWMLFPRIWRGIRATAWLVWNKLQMPGRRQPLTEPITLDCKVGEELGELLRSRAAIEPEEVTATVRCLSGRSRGVRGLSANLEGILVLTTRPDKVFFAASKGLSDRVFALPLFGAVAEVESKFLSENLTLDITGGGQAVFRFPRGQGAIAESLRLLIQDKIEASKKAASQVFEAPLTVLSPATADGKEEPVSASILPVPAIG